MVRKKWLSRTWRHKANAFVEDEECKEDGMSKLYDVPVGFVNPPILRLCIALFAVAEGWLLLDIG